MWTDRELEVMHFALGNLGDLMSNKPDEWEPGFEQAHSSLSLRISEELARRESK